MRVLLSHSSSSAGSVHYRIDQPARVARAAGVDVAVRMGLATTMRRPSEHEDPVVVDVDSEGADVVVVQLPKTAEMLQCIRILRQRGVAVVVEIDDLLSAVPYGHMAH